MMSPSDPLHELLGGLAERWGKALDPEQDVQALVRVATLEARRNLAILDLVVGQGAAIPPASLWDIPGMLQTEALQVVLGQGLLTQQAFAGVRRLKATDAGTTPDAADVLTHIYVRIAALQALASVPRRQDLKQLRIRSRLTTLHTDFSRVVAVLGREVKK